MTNFQISRAVRNVLMTAGFAYPVRFTACFGLSYLIYLTLQSLYLDYPNNNLLFVVHNYPMEFVASLGSVLAFGRAIFRPMLGSDRASDNLELIEIALSKSGFNKHQKHLIWQSIMTKLISELEFNKKISRQDIDKISSDAIDEFRKSTGEGFAEK